MSARLPQASAPLMGADARAMRRELAGAPDAQLLQVLHYVDSLPERGPADALLAPLRPRLRELRPVRPLRFPRLLVLPIEPVLVNTPDWRMGDPTVPRGAILPLAALVRQAAPAECATIDGLIAGRRVGDAAVRLAAGSIAWPLAARVLAATPAAPAAWTAAGLRAADFAPLASAIGIVFGHALLIKDLWSPVVHDDEREPHMRRLLRLAAAAGGLAWGLMLGVLLARFPQSDTVRRAAADAGERERREMAEAALDQALGRVERHADIGTMVEAADEAEEVSRQIALLDALQDTPLHRARAKAARADLWRALVSRIEAGVQDRFLDQLRALGPEQARSGQGVDELEREARALRKLENEARRLAGQGAEARLRQAAKEVADRADVSRMDRARLVEILLGPTAALGLLRQR